jgi:hypothetical protein
MISRTALALAFVAGVCLSGCGKLGDLDQPAPLFGQKAKSDYELHKQEAAQARAHAAATPPPENTDVDSNAPPLQDAPYAPTLPGRNDTMPPQGPQGSLPQPGEPGAPD